ncbi:alpha/beta hydrolase [Acinetobacter bereziniae]|uniref:RBBP9/YdeN family alpha/beta hydrolase n=1 Tax=Acinetobacter TaxID=469 RepID=UPI0002AEC1E4|nr:MULTISPECIES: alpha/beta hydrolase [Acinetobacter]ELW90224.1 serine hydrolase [Acinetobacter sp. WC-743]MBJ8421496.1 alpha/beta hydrolase [Acinetobacter bereziniae]MBJ8424867.1 alpha/beta hydrolase [Acinetobacter bereziniae]MBJ8474701.1 alpha/beta hydrolase [Acinetobacter bereziniae]MCU4473510.1 alpha/beta hydrolase [Acinetobacter bereziniae]
MIHTIIVPGVGGSDYDHWQSKLQRELMSCSRVQQQDWNLPILKDWVAEFVRTVLNAPQPVQIVAHSFGCLTTVAALAQHPEITTKVRKVILVAPANPTRFGEAGFARNSIGNYENYFQTLNIAVPAEMIISENDPWLDFEDAQKLARAWKIKPRNLGQVGHINVASGFGHFPEIYDHLIIEQQKIFMSNTDDTKLFFKFAI